MKPDLVFKPLDFTNHKVASLHEEIVAQTAQSIFGEWWKAFISKAQVVTSAQRILKENAHWDLGHSNPYATHKGLLFGVEEIKEHECKPRLGIDYVPSVGQWARCECGAGLAPTGWKKIGESK